MRDLYNPQAPKKPTNVSVNSDLLEQGRRFGINLSATLEQALSERLQAELRSEWKRENADAIRAYNDLVEEHGSFSDSVRKF